MTLRWNWRGWAVLLGLVALGLLTACGPRAAATPDDLAGATALAAPVLPDIAPVALDGHPLRVLATTSIIGDVVAQIGGAAIDLSTLMAPGQDPHSYQPGAADLAAAADADLIFVNGWGLEEGLVDDLATIGDTTPIPVSAGITPLPAAGAADGPVPDPHVWQDVSLVMRWADTIAAALSAADPANAATFAANAAAYRVTLAALDDEVRAGLAGIPAGRRVLVTNHDTFAYFAAAYDFRVLGAVIPGASTLAEPTAANLTGLARQMAMAGVCSLFVETIANDQLARTLAGELDACEEVRILSLYSDALGAPGSGADSYVGMMRANVLTIIEGLE